MAEISVLLQGLNEGDDHETAVNGLLSIPEIDHFLFSVAFASSNGVGRISGKLCEAADKAQVFVGIRNGITSLQSISSLLKIGIAPYVVDTASSSKKFHMKIYAAYNDRVAHVILGSANLTYDGLNQNIEAGSHIKLDRKLPADEKFLGKITSSITGLPTAYPDHVFQVKTARHAVRLTREGRLEDERRSRLHFQSGIRGDGERDMLIPIPTHGRKDRSPRKKVAKRQTQRAENFGTPVWKSKPLTERSLNIPQGENTNVTGDINLGKGLMENVDFQSYFRDEVFSGLEWKKDESSRSPHLERATIKAEVVIKKILYGTYSLEVTHDPRTDTKSYGQKNATTKMKWGAARPIVAKKDLLNRNLTLYRKDSDDFMIVID